MLRCAASLAAHGVMARRGWLVPAMVEFQPRAQGLLGININRGQRIKVRLRDGGGGFLPFVSILGTVLHELVHNEIGPHNAQFYAMFDAFWGEVEALPGYDEHMHEYNNGYFDREYSAAGAPRAASGAAVPFQGQGRKLGVRGGTSLLNSRVRDGDLPAMRARAAAAAMQRAGAAPSSSSHRLGGRRSAAAGMTPAQAAARAAMRRAQDDLSCRLGVIEIDDDSEDDDGGGGGGGGNDDKENAGGRAAAGPPANAHDPIVIDDSDSADDAARAETSKRPRAARGGGGDGGDDDGVIDLCSQ